MGWRAEGIERARAAGGVDLELYWRPGFTGGVAVRRSSVAGGCGFHADDDRWEDDDVETEPRARRWTSSPSRLVGGSGGYAG